MKDKITIQEIKENINFLELAMYFEEEKIEVTYNNIKMCCPFHEEKTPSFFYNIEKRFGYCFGCNESCDAIDYVSHKLNVGFKQSVEFIVKFFKIDKDISNITSRAGGYKKQLEAIKKYLPAENNDIVYREEDIARYIDFRNNLKLKTQFDKDTLDYFQVGFDPKERRIVVPVRDENGTLLGFTGRTISGDYKNEGIQKWKHYKGTKVSNTLFNIKSAIEYSIKYNNSIIIVEGPKDVMWLHQNGIKNCAACLTNTISQKQKGILLRNFTSIYLLLDGDNGGEIGKTSIIEKINGFFNIYDVSIGKGKDPDNLTKEELISAIRNANKIR